MQNPLFSAASTFVFSLVLMITMYWCFSTAQTPAWSLGEEPTFSGVIENWSIADGLSSGEGNMVVRNMPFFGESYSNESQEIGFGNIKQDGSFNLSLTKDAAGSFTTPDWYANCPTITPSNPSLKVATVTAIEVPELYEEKAHARPQGAVLISSVPITANNIASRVTYMFIYADSEGTFKGTCIKNTEDYSFNIVFDLDLHKGWNSLRFESLDASYSFTTAAIPTEAKWYMVNALTLE